MIKIKTITFHHAHNFGSVLQAYALQEFIAGLGSESDIEIDYKIIDFYTEEQEELYRVFKHRKCLKNVIKNMVALLYAKKLKIKYNKFESFLNEKCNLTKRYHTKEDLIKNTPQADFYISGSDQIWNVRATDFSDVYYLDFVKKGKKISYAASFGPLEIDWRQYDKKKYEKFLKSYKTISVREQGSAQNVERLTGSFCTVNVDPTMLLTVDKWRKVQSDANYNNGKYILLYCLEPTKKQLKLVDAISQKLNLPVVVLRYNNKNDMFNHYVKKYDSGPKDFLAYIDHAALVISSSFHGTVFSLLYHKPFYILDGMKDNRISSILKRIDMIERSLETVKDIERVNLEKPSEAKIENLLREERDSSKRYIREGLEIG